MSATSMSWFTVTTYLWQYLKNRRKKKKKKSDYTTRKTKMNKIGVKHQHFIQYFNYCNYAWIMVRVLISNTSIDSYTPVLLI